MGIVPLRLGVATCTIAMFAGLTTLAASCQECAQPTSGVVAKSYSKLLRSRAFQHGGDRRRKLSRSGRQAWMAGKRGALRSAISPNIIRNVSNVRISVDGVAMTVAHAAVGCKHSFAAPTTRATRLAAPSRKLNRPCVMAPIGLITQWSCL